MDTATAQWSDFVALDEAAQVTKALEIMAEVVTEYGREYVYRKPAYGSCLYVHTWHRDGKAIDVPGCLIGHVLHRLGVSLAELAATDSGGTLTNEDGDMLDSGISDYGHRLGLHETTVDVLSRAQGLQDIGYRWGHAYDAAVALSPSHMVG